MTILNYLKFCPFFFKFRLMVRKMKKFHFNDMGLFKYDNQDKKTKAFKG